MNDFKWTIKKVWVEDVSIRTHANAWTEKEEPYAVIYCGPYPTGEKREETSRHEIKRRNTVMCFEEHVFRRIATEQEYGFSGKVRFGYGNTYLLATKAFDALGVDVTDESSLCFHLWEGGFTEDCDLLDSEMGEPEIAE